MTATYETRIAERRASLMKQRVERMDELDLPRTMTQREVNAYIAETADLDKRIADFESTVAAWAALPTLDADTTWLAHLNEWRPKLCDELLAIKSPIRDRDVKAQYDRLTFAIRLIDFGFGIAKTLPIVDLSSTRIGELMRAAGYETQGEALRGPRGWRGSIKEVERRVKALTQERAAAQALLDVALLTDDERAKAEADSAAQRAALETMDVRQNQKGDGLAAWTLDGDPLAVTDMTPEQRAAFTWFERVSFPPRQTVES
jgi:hypothetical protein